MNTVCQSATALPERDLYLSHVGFLWPEDQHGPRVRLFDIGAVGVEVCLVAFGDAETDRLVDALKRHRLTTPKASAARRRQVARAARDVAGELGWTLTDTDRRRLDELAAAGVAS